MSTPTPAPAPRQATSGTTTAIHDIGYRRYQGPRLGQGYLMRSLIIDGIRSAYGIGRSGKSKIMPFLLFGIMLLTALVIAVITATTRTEPELRYATFGMGMQIVVVLYAAGQAPTLVSRDLRDGVVPLYFSRPLRRGRYVAAKVAAMTAALFAFVAVPVLLVYGGALLGQLPFWSNTGDLARGLLATLLQSAVIGAISLTVAAYLPQRGIGLTVAVATYIVTSMVYTVIFGILLNTADESTAGWATLASPYFSIGAVQHWILRVDSGLAYNPPGWPGGATATALLILVLVGCWAALQRRYRKAM